MENGADRKPTVTQTSRLYTCGEQKSMSGCTIFCPKGSNFFFFLQPTVKKHYMQQHANIVNEDSKKKKNNYNNIDLLYLHKIALLYICK